MGNTYDFCSAEQIVILITKSNESGINVNNIQHLINVISFVSTDGQK